ncbi:polysaccharide biosynthesis protein, partial [Enterococcus faecium]
KEYRIAPLAKIRNFFLKTFRSTLIMLAVCVAVFFLLNQRLSMESKSYAMFYCVAVGSIGGVLILIFQFGKNRFRMLKK